MYMNVQGGSYPDHPYPYLGPYIQVTHICINVFDKTILIPEILISKPSLKPLELIYMYIYVYTCIYTYDIILIVL
jgi:hypothetical protein